MGDNTSQIKFYVTNNSAKELTDLLNLGLDPNLEGGWPIRLAARQGNHSIVKILVEFGANPHLLSESGASTLQLAVYSGKNWNGDKWNFLLSCCDSSQLADGAAVAIIFENIVALENILATGRCNTNIPTTLTGKTVEQLAKGYKLHHMLIDQNSQNQRVCTPNTSPTCSTHTTAATRASLSLTPRQNPGHRNLSPSVARFFHQTANQISLTSPRNPVVASPSDRRMTT